MTTIAYRDGTLAADTMMVRGGEFSYSADKIFQTERFLVGLSGDLPNFIPFVDWLLKHERFLKDKNAGDLHTDWDLVPDYGQGFCAILIDRDGSIWSCVDAPPVRVHAEYEAIGSGAKYAMGAMAMGASAADAIQAAMKHDIQTGGPVSLLRLRK